MLATVNLFAGLAWNPGVRGILTVAVAVAVLMGSVYILLATNTGVRLGMLLALTGLFGWLVILTFFWWLSPPAIGPRGNNGTWKPVEIVVNDGSVPKTEVVSTLVNPNDLPTSQEILAKNQADLAAGTTQTDLATEYPNGFLLSDLAANNPDILAEVLPSDALFGWRVTPSSSAGESQAAADAALIEAKLFTANTDYKKLNVFEIGGKPRPGRRVLATRISSAGRSSASSGSSPSGTTRSTTPWSRSSRSSPRRPSPARRPRSRSPTRPSPSSPSCSSATSATCV